MQHEIHHFASLTEACTSLVREIIRLARQATEARGIFSLVLAGGNTPLQLYSLLAAPSLLAEMPWQNTHLFWGDERWVPPEHPDSNFGMAADAMLRAIPLPDKNIHRIQGEAASAETAANLYERELRAFFADQPPVFDLILLGMGADGHTASLFPQSPALEEKNRWVTAIPAPRNLPAVDRITLTLPVLNLARHLFFLLTGPEKLAIVQQIVDNQKDAAQTYPAALIKPAGHLAWFTATK